LSSAGAWQETGDGQKPREELHLFTYYIWLKTPFSLFLSLSLFRESILQYFNPSVDTSNNLITDIMMIAVNPCVCNNSETNLEVQTNNDMFSYTAVILL
jgi:hypothetical protein